VDDRTNPGLATPHKSNTFSTGRSDRANVYRSSHHISVGLYGDLLPPIIFFSGRGKKKTKKQIVTENTKNKEQKNQIKTQDTN